MCHINNKTLEIVILKCISALNPSAVSLNNILMLKRVIGQRC